MGQTPQQDKTNSSGLKFSQMILLFSGIVTFFAIFFGGMISLISKVSFFAAAGYIAGAFTVLFITGGVFAWFWDKLSGHHQDTIQKIAIGFLILSVLILAPSGMFGGSKWSGEGTVNLFPESASSKNYRLPADISVKTEWWWQRSYNITAVEWPNEGRSYFTDCIISNENSYCEDDEGRNWKIEVEEAPESTSSDNY